MRTPSLIATCLLTVALFVSLPADALGDYDKNFVKDTKTYFSRLEKLGFAGSVMITVKGKPILAEGYGDAKRNPSVPWTPHTVSTTGSITKQFTAAAIMRLQEQGKLNVYDTLDKHFKDVPADKAGITLHHLLSHDSGIIDPPNYDDFDENTRDGYVHTVLDAPLNSEPGTTFEYANANFSLLGAIIEQIVGTNYETAMRKLIFEPAGMKYTGYTMPDYSNMVVADGYIEDEKWGSVLERPMADDGPYWALRANGGIYSNAVEMVQWGQALLDNKVLTAESRDAMWTGHADESNGEGRSFYGYGWSVQQPMPDVKVITHNGGNGILFADMMIIPEKEVVAFVQTNVAATFRMSGDLLNQMTARAYGGEYPDLPHVVDAKPSALAELTGSYALGDDKVEVEAAGNALVVTPHGWNAYAVVRSMPTQDAAPLLEMSAQVDKIVGSFLKGDYQPLHDAYQGRVPIDRLENVYSERLAQRESEFGKLNGYEVLGTCTGEEYHFTIVRYRYEREPILRTYVWDIEDTSNLLGVTMRRMTASCKFYPIAGGGFQSWDPSTGASVRAQLVDGRFVLMRDAGEVVLAR